MFNRQMTLAVGPMDIGDNRTA